MNRETPGTLPLNPAVSLTPHCVAPGVLCTLQDLWVISIIIYCYFNVPWWLLRRCNLQIWRQAQGLVQPWHWLWRGMSLGTTTVGMVPCGGPVIPRGMHCYHSRLRLNLNPGQTWILMPFAVWVDAISWVHIHPSPAGFSLPKYLHLPEPLPSSQCLFSVSIQILLGFQCPTQWLHPPWNLLVNSDGISALFSATQGPFYVFLMVPGLALDLFVLWVM